MSKSNRNLAKSERDFLRCTQKFPSGIPLQSNVRGGTNATVGVHFEKLRGFSLEPQFRFGGKLLEI